MKRYSDKTITGYVASTLTELMYSDPTVLSRFCAWFDNTDYTLDIMTDNIAVFFRHANSPRFDNKLIISSYYKINAIRVDEKKVEFDWPKDTRAFVGRVCSQVQNFM